MFRTYRHAELELHNVFGADFQMWHFIELGIHRPWFYAGTRECDGDDCSITMKMIPNVAVLECLLEEHSIEIDSLQILSPGHVNGTSGWRMEDLVEVAILGDEEGRSSGYRYSVEGGKSYDVPDRGSSPSNFKVHKVVFTRP